MKYRMEIMLIIGHLRFFCAGVYVSRRNLGDSLQGQRLAWIHNRKTRAREMSVRKFTETTGSGCNKHLTTTRCILHLLLTGVSSGVQWRGRKNTVLQTS